MVEDRTARRPLDARWVEEDGSPMDEDHRGLVYDIRTLVDRRRVLGLFGGIAATSLLAACSTGTTTGTGSGSGSDSGSSGSSDPGTSTSDAAVVEIPDETNGPFPADGTNGVNVLDDSGIVRSDIRSSFGSSTTTAEGVPLTITLAVRDASTGDALVGAAVYVWHCDRDGNYSLYSDGVSDENYLRGVQEVGDDGTVTFTSIYPACYSGRWPHVHFEVYGSIDDAVSKGPIVKTSQLALPKETDDVVYATDGYERSVQNLARVSLADDNVFGDDGGIHQVATMSGSVSTGYTAALTLGV